MAKSAADMSKNWTQAMSNAQTAQKYRDGINRTTVNPMELAASDQATQLYLNNVQASVNSGKRQRKLREANVQTWKQNASTVGANALQTGATKAKPKVDAHFQKWQPIYQQASDAARAVPKDGSKASALARVSAALDVMMGAAGKQ